jgi:hypothetical protein
VWVTADGFTVRRLCELHQEHAHELDICELALPRCSVARCDGLGVVLWTVRSDSGRVALASLCAAHDHERSVTPSLESLTRQTVETPQRIPQRQVG